MCDCSICLRGKRIEGIQNGNDIEKMREIISELHNLVLNLEFDNEINTTRIIELTTVSA